VSDGEKLSGIVVANGLRAGDCRQFSTPCCPLAFFGLLPFDDTGGKEKGAGALVLVDRP
jgi:hypothetical protein